MASKDSQVRGRILAVDVYYWPSGTASAAGVLFDGWESPEPLNTLVREVDDVARYQPGRFYLRELPCILRLLKAVDVGELQALIVDGYVMLGRNEKPGLGMYLFEALGKSVPIIGVAKNEFPKTPKECRVVRGNSKRPLFVTSVGVSHEFAKEAVRCMHGQYRIPTLLKWVDRLCRDGESRDLGN